MALNWVIVVWSMIASACFTLGAIYLLVWLRNPRERANLFFSLNAMSMVAFAFCELWIMRVQTIGEGVVALRWAIVALTVWLLSNVWFVKTYLGAGRAWLAWTILILRLAVLPVNFLPGQNLPFAATTSLEQVMFFGQQVTVLNGVVNPWQIVAQFSILLILVFVADASRTASRSGNRRKALMVGGSVAFTIVAAIVNAQWAIWELAYVPFMFSLPYSCLVFAMGYELSRNVIRGAELVRELEASNQQISSLFGRLIASQETERTRIARDLHDEIGQRVAGIAIAMSGVKRLIGANANAVAALVTIQHDTHLLADQVRHVSHELHPTLLQHAGLAEALRALCAQFQRVHGITVDYRGPETIETMPQETALALYRVAQEALHNVSKHAAASHVELALRQDVDGTQLSIVDNGRGFDLAAADGRKKGLGLVSIDERVRFLQGRVDITTTPGGGTSVVAQVPKAVLT
jgi:signal transduction histidine kinase